MSKSKVTTVRPKYDACMAHYRDACELWRLRSLASKMPNYNESDLSSMENRVAGHINELLLLPETSWEVCQKLIAEPLEGSFFVGAVLAFRSYDQNKIKTIVESATGEYQSVRELVSALGWMPAEITENWVEKLFYSKDLWHKYIAVSVSSIRREDPKEDLSKLIERQDCQSNSVLYARCLRLIGELKRQDLKSHLLIAGEHEDPNVRFWAIWSLMLLGEYYRADALKPFVMEANLHRDRAIDVVFRLLPGAAARQWISELSQSDENDRAVIRAMATLGDPKGINWLISKMRDTRLARLAAEAFYHITGIGIDTHRLAMEVPDLTGMVPAKGKGESKDKQVSNIDENLPWPDVDKVSAVWLKYGNRFRAGQRYFLGERITQDLLKRILSSSTQRLRYSAALELSLQDSYAPLVNIGAWHE